MDEKFKLLVDDGTLIVNVGHIFKSNFQGRRGKDMCLEYWGEEDDDCRAYNKQYENLDETSK